MSASRERLIDRGWRYTLVGLACAVANTLIMIAVDRLGGHYLIGTVISFLIVTPTAYVLHSRFTFAEPLRWRAFLRFVGTVAGTYPVAVAVLALLCTGFHLNVAIATPISIVTLFVWNFVAAHWAILPKFDFSGSIASTESPLSEPAGQRKAKL